VYGSESEDSEGDSEDEFIKSQSRERNGKAKGGQTYIVEDEDEPLDLLSKQAMGNISTTKPLRKREVPQKKTKARTNEDGKLILGDSDDEAPRSKKNKHSSAPTEEDGDVLMDVDQDGVSLEAGINAYVDAIRGRDAAQRGQKGKLKFSNKRRQDEDEMEVDHDDRESRKAKSGSGMGRGGARGGGRGNATPRRGLGVEKGRGGGGGGGRGRGTGRVEKGRSPRGKGSWRGSR
jgi:ribosomal RNA-processing protein 12